jgi:hypothetical protein
MNLHCRHIVLALGCALGLGAALLPAAAQPVWRCGSDGRSFSDRPCADGRELPAVASPSDADRLQAQGVARRQAALAEQLRAERHARAQVIESIEEPQARQPAHRGRRAGESTGRAAREEQREVQPALRSAKAAAPTSARQRPLRTADAGTSAARPRASRRAPG